MRAIEQGQLKIRVRSLENEMALTRLGTQSSGMTNLLLSSLVLNVASVAKLARIPQLGLFGIAGCWASRGFPVYRSGSFGQEGGEGRRRVQFLS